MPIDPREYYSKERAGREWAEYQGYPEADEARLAQPEPARQANLAPAKIWMQALILFPTVILVALNWNTWPLLIVSAIVLVILETGVKS